MKKYNLIDMTQIATAVWCCFVPSISLPNCFYICFVYVYMTWCAYYSYLFTLYYNFCNKLTISYIILYFGTSLSKVFLTVYSIHTRVSLIILFYYYCYLYFVSVCLSHIHTHTIVPCCI